MVRPRAFIAAIAVVALSFLGGVTLSIVLAQNAIQSSQHQWCQALVILTKTPVPAPANPQTNPSRENAFQFYQHLRQLEVDFRC